MTTMIDFRCRYKSENPNDYLVEIKGGRFMFLPKSSTQLRKNNKPNKYDFVSIPLHVAEDKGLVPKPVSPVTERIRQDQATATSPTDWAGAIDRMVKAVQAIAEDRERLRGIGGSIEIPCPSCQKTLHVDISPRNGHAHGECETPNCTKWME